MDVLYVTGACLTRNTSANMSHNAFIQGLLENGCAVDIVMAKDSWGEPDQELPIFENASYTVFSSLSGLDKLRLMLRGNPSGRKSDSTSDSKDQVTKKDQTKKRIRRLAKKVFYAVNKPDPVYPLEKRWLKEAARFKSSKHYDLVISNSSPAASHRLVIELTKKGNIQFSRWVQIWEDPWYHDLYGKYPIRIKEEEHNLLRHATEIVYVSPLTLMYQRQYYPDCAEKMHCVPLPALQFSKVETKEKKGEFSLGYFGDYYSEARNLKPFYEAIRETGYRCYIYGDSDLYLEKTEIIEISGRVTLDRLREVQDNTAVLVHLCNLHGGQIPGKIYHYSVTNKPILFILDGTKDEKNMLIDYFGRFNRYYFCNNKKEDIRFTIEQIAYERKWFPVIEEFLPKEVVKRLLH